MIRQPAVAGQFYAGNPDKLKSDLQNLVIPSKIKQKAIGIISPHAGYMYSGTVAGGLFGALEIPDTVIILGPNHRGFGARSALYPQGEWITPLGPVPVNAVLSSLVRKHAPFVEEDSIGHQFEHSLEVQVPFLQYLKPDVTIVPICLGFNDFTTCRRLGEGIAKAITEYGEPTLIVASSDMTHYESAASARQKDNLALNQVVALNAEGLYTTCRAHDITMCGVIPSTTMLIAAIELGATKAEIVDYRTSGEVSGDNSEVVAYAAVKVF